MNKKINMDIQERKNLNCEQAKIVNSEEIFIDNIILPSKIVPDIKAEILTVDGSLENAKTNYHHEQPFDVSMENIIDEDIKINDEFSQSIETNQNFCYGDVKKEQAESLYCENCEDLLEDFCLKCFSPLYVLNNELPNILYDNTEEAIPRNILIIKKNNNHEKGVFTLKTFPKDAEFGPFCGLTNSKKERGLIWKIKQGKLMSGDNAQYLNWMQHIRSVKDTSHQNLMVFQYKGDMYFRSIKEITKGSELLVHYGLDDAMYLNDEAVIHYRPGTERKLRNIFACTFCCVGFSSEVNLVKHKNKCPYEEIKNSIFNIITQCPLCKIYLLEREYKELHSTYCSKIEEDTPSAPELDFTANSDDEDTQSQRSSANEEKQCFVCKICNKGFVEQKYLELHLRSKHKPGHNSDFKGNLNTDENVKQFPCEFCNKQFDRNHRLQLHLKNKHLDPDNKAYKCSKCPYQTNRKKCFQVHLHRHSDKKPFVCKDCGAQFIQKQYLQLHMKRTHSSDDQKEYKCAKCPYETDRKNNMRRHMTIHVNPEEKVYKCPKCSFETNHRDSLYRHQRVHDETKKYECKICKQRFNFRPNLSVHVKYVHNVVEEKYGCSKCSYQTNRKDSLKRHLYSHGDVKPFKCKICDKQFIRSTNLKHHLINIHKERA